MNMFEEARALAITMNMRKMSQSKLASMLGVSQSFVANKLRLLKLDEDMQNQILTYKLTERHARALLKLTDKESRQTVLDRICTEGLSVARSEALVDFYHCAEAPKYSSKAEGLTATYSFLDNLNNWVDFLSRSGAKTSKKVSHEGSKIYVTICIE